MNNEIMASITDYVIKLQELTQRNMDILQALNDSFFTNQSHLTVNVGENQYAIPSFIALENRLNSLKANFENLVRAPQTGEAFFNFDGDSRAIEVRSYTTTPNSLVLKPVENFGVDKNDIFKDFLTPVPYISLSTKELPNDITEVLVKKIIPVNSELKTSFKNSLKNTTSSVQYKYSDLYKILSLYELDKDYIEYDTKVSMPIRKSIGSGTYVIEEILEDRIDENLDNYITIKLRSNLDSNIYMSSLKYKLFDETIERELKVGDQLVTYEGNAKMEIMELFPSTNSITIKVLHGDFINLVPSYNNEEKYIVDLNKIKLFSPIDFDSEKIIKVSLEEDEYIFVALAALNSRMNIQAPWGTGLMLNTYNLTNNDVKFSQYYKENVKNVGDILFEITSMISNPLTKYTEEEFKQFTSFKPIINRDNILVTRINDHLNNSSTVQNIRGLYSQKKVLQAELNEIEKGIKELNESLSAISFDDTTGRRAAYTSQISSLNIRRGELITSITKIMDEISISANSSEVPIENAKYRIRGFFDTSDIKWEDHIKGIRVQYRYKNENDKQNTALTFDEKFVFSDWNEMKSFDRSKIPYYENGLYVSKMEEKNNDSNNPSFSQIDIPISQGESVDIRLKLVYDLGDPFVQTTSDWSDITTMIFPSEYLKDVKILDIIEENNNDIETNRFNNIIKEEGIPEHVGDKITDQDMTYFHKPENISSGFYTAERRIIPLKDKLEDLSNTLIALKDEVYGTASESLKISLKHGLSEVSLNPLVDNKIYTDAYASISSTNYTSDGNYEYNNSTGLVTTVFNLSLLNDSEHIVKLYSMFPGNRDTDIQTLINYKFDKRNFYIEYESPTIDQPESQSDEIADLYGIWYEHPKEGDKEQAIQGGNQFIYFRVKEVNTGESLYGIGDQSDKNKILSAEKGYIKCLNDSSIEKTSMWVYPKLTQRYGLCIDSNEIGSYITLKPNEEFIIPIVVEFYVKSEQNEISKIISFDILPSLYKDPITYKFTITAKYQNSVQDKLISNNLANAGTSKYNIVYR